MRTMQNKMNMLLVCVYSFLCLLTAGAGTEEEANVQTKAKWTKELEAARRVFQASNDRESAEFISRMQVSLERPEGLAPAALAANRERVKQFTRDLIRRGALESAATLKNMNFRLTWIKSADVPDGPVRPNRQNRAGSPGPGGLVLYLPFDAPPANGVVRDESGAGNDGRVEGAQWVSKGRMGGAYRFSITNVDDRIVIPDSDSLGVQYVTLSAWVMGTDTDGLPNRIVDKDRRKGYSLGLNGGGQNKQEIVGIDITWSTGTSVKRLICDGHWHHVAGTYDGQISKLYVDGNMVRQQQTQSPGPIPRNHWDLCVGNSVVDYEGGTFGSFDGLIDEVRVYNRALSAEEIKGLATMTKAGMSASAPAAGAVGAAATLTAAERIKQAKELFEQGVLSKDAYDRKVKEIVESL